jgi:hypothetical protein
MEQLRTKCITSTRADAAQLVALSVLEGDEREAWLWATEYALQRDGALTPAEATTWLELSRVRHEELERRPTAAVLV